MLITFGIWVCVIKLYFVFTLMFEAWDFYSFWPFPLLTFNRHLLTFNSHPLTYSYCFLLSQCFWAWVNLNIELTINWLSKLSNVPSSNIHHLTSSIKVQAEVPGGLSECQSRWLRLRSSVTAIQPPEPGGDTGAGASDGQSYQFISWPLTVSTVTHPDPGNFFRNPVSIQLHLLVFSWLVKLI